MIPIMNIMLVNLIIKGKKHSSEKQIFFKETVSSFNFCWIVCAKFLFGHFLDFLYDRIPLLLVCVLAEWLTQLQDSCILLLKLIILN